MIAIRGETGETGTRGEYNQVFTGMDPISSLLFLNIGETVVRQKDVGPSLFARASPIYF